MAGVVGSWYRADAAASTAVAAAAAAAAAETTANMASGRLIWRASFCGVQAWSPGDRPIVSFSEHQILGGDYDAQAPSAANKSRIWAVLALTQATGGDYGHRSSAAAVTCGSPAWREARRRERMRVCYSWNPTTAAGASRATHQDTTVCRSLRGAGEPPRTTSAAATELRLVRHGDSSGDGRRVWPQLPCAYCRLVRIQASPWGRGLPNSPHHEAVS